MIHTEVLQQYPHVDVVEKRLETGHICNKEKKTIKNNDQDASLVLLHKKSLGIRFAEACLKCKLKI